MKKRDKDDGLWLWAGLMLLFVAVALFAPDGGQGSPGTYEVIHVEGVPRWGPQ